MSNIPYQIKQQIERTVEYLGQNGLHKEELIKQQQGNNPEFSFLYPGTPFYQYYKTLLEESFLNRSRDNNQQMRSEVPNVQRFSHVTQSSHYERKSRWNDAPIVMASGNLNQNVDQNTINHHNFAMNVAQNNPAIGMSSQQQGLHLGSYPFFSPQNLPPNINNMQPSYPNMPGIFSTIYQSRPQNFVPVSSQFNQFINVNPNNNARGQEAQQLTNDLSKTPEDIPCGMMAEMIRQQIKKLKDNHQSHATYVPLDPFLTPQNIKTSQGDKASEYQKSKMDSLYKFIDEERDLENRTKKSRKPRENEYEGESSKSKSNNKKSVDYGPNVSTEFGFKADGQSINAFGSGDGRRGLGMDSEDIYSKFRKNRSHQYHVSAEERSFTRDQPDLCYVCQMPGHIARDCKFGLT